MTLILASCFFCVFALLFIAQRLSSSEFRSAADFFVKDWPVKVAIALLGLFFVAEGALYVANSRLSWFEPEVGSIIGSILFARGEPVYHPIDGAQRYALLYGPLLTMVYGWIFAVFPTITSVKLAGIAFAFIGVVLTMRLICTRQSVAWRWSLMLFASIALGFLGKSLLMARADALIFLLASLAALAAVAWRHPLLWIGAAAGVASGFKVTAVLYFVPLALLFLRTGGWPVFFLSAGLFGVALALPFFHPQVGVTEYLQWLKAATVHSYNTQVFLSNLGVAGFFFVPLVVQYLVFRERRLADFGFVMSAILVAFLGSKLGGGQYHLLPFLPILMALIVRRPTPEIGTWMHHDIVLPAAKGAVLLMTIPACFVFLTSSSFLQPQLFGVKNPYKMDPAALDEALSFGERFGFRQTSVGYGQMSSRNSNALANLAAKGAPILLTDVAMWDMDASKLPVPEGTVEAVRTCQIPVWLIPTGDRPFAGGSVYFPDSPVFEPLPRVFLGAYSLSEQGRYFDVWKCQRQ